MGNQHSHESMVTEAVASSLSPKARRRISKSPIIQTFIETANKTSNAPRSMPSLTSTWYETSGPTTYSQQQQKQRTQQMKTSSVQTSTMTTTTTTKPSATQNQNQQVISQTTTTTRKPSGNPKQPYYLVSTTTYYIKGPSSASSRSNSTDGLYSSLGKEAKRLSLISQATSQTSSSNASSTTGSDNNEELYYSQRPPRGIKYTNENGRKFMMAPGLPYKMVCDDDESDRLIILHFLLKYAFNGNVMAPIQDILTKATLCKASKNKRPQVVDIGCGPGTWVLEMATEFPNADFHGVDICPMFPATIKPNNTFFKQQNILDGLPYPDNSIDFLHVRLMLTSLTQEQALKILGEIMRVLKPNGYVELRDVEYRVQRPGPVTDALINRKLYEFFDKSYNIKFDLSHHMSTLLMMSCRQEGGFVDIHQEKVTVPLGWGGQLGEIHSQNLDAFLKSLDPKIREATTTQSKLSDWEPAGMENTTTMLTDSAIEHMIKECTKYQSHFNWFVCYGRKPAAPTVVTGPPPTSPTTTTPARHSMNITPAVSAVNVDAVIGRGCGNSSHLSSSPIEEGAWASINDFAEGYVD
ncbi:S-adenosyl-L-methionine-dependent methyltransferase [Phascolomyces articulosus]|uniref:S-adenosyl-L-methionine-dependent methyltransferase n=1 Tax=Phascolomyces articulosus TaxID=60185 RepID=A0AAD5JQ77_9FUNG|nr:S-adenosyl-L-methionine-dependent methyltransferase [Phascolomyces articulosus]